MHIHAFGPPAPRDAILVIPGGPGLSHDYLLPLSRLAGPDRSIVFYDPRGTGRSGDSADLSLDTQALDLDAVRRASGAQRVHVLGHSWGAIIAVAYALAFPERVTSLILVGMGPPTAAADRRVFATAFAARKARLIKQGLVSKDRPPPRGDDCMAGFSASLPVHFADPRHPAAHRLPGSYRCGVHARGVAAAGAWDFRRGLGELAAPVLFVIGDADANAAGLPETARLVGDGTTAPLPACGHFPFLECPGGFFSAVERFLRSF